MPARWTTSDKQKNFLTIDILEAEDLDDHKEITRWMQSWGLKKSFTGLSSWPEKKN